MSRQQKSQLRFKLYRVYGYYPNNGESNGRENGTEMKAGLI